MPLSDAFLTSIAALLICTSFIKIATALSVFRYGVGLTGIELGIVTLVASFGIALGTLPSELSGLGFPGSFFSEPSKIDGEKVVNLLTPYMRERIDPAVEKGLTASEGASGQTDGQTDSGIGRVDQLRRVLPVFILSELKSAMTIGCYLLIPFVTIDLIAAHVLTLVGIQGLAVQAVSLPLKILLFLAVDGWALLGKKILGM